MSPKRLKFFASSVASKGNTLTKLLEEENVERVYDLSRADLVVFGSGPPVWPGLQLDMTSVRGMAPVRDLIDVTHAVHALRQGKYVLGYGGRGAQLVNMLCGGTVRAMPKDIRVKHHKTAHSVIDSFHRDEFRVGSDHDMYLLPADGKEGGIILGYSNETEPVIEVVGYPMLRSLAFMPEVKVDIHDYTKARERMMEMVNEMVEGY